MASMNIGTTCAKSLAPAQVIDKQPQVATQVLRYDRNLSQLANLVDALHSRLESFMRPGDNSPENIKEPSEMLAPAALTLSQYNTRLEQQMYSLEDILNRLEV